MDYMNYDYKGRTARFERNGHIYYAEFDSSALRKNIYGDNTSDSHGYKAKINMGASGDIFDVVENSDYERSAPEKHNKKRGKAHKQGQYWDYFVKTIQIDNRIYDLIANIRKQYYADRGFVYSLGLKENKKIKAMPPLSPPNTAAFNGVPVASGLKIAQPEEAVKGPSNNYQNNEPDSDDGSIAENDEQPFSIVPQHERTMEEQLAMDRSADMAQQAYFRDNPRIPDINRKVRPTLRTETVGEQTATEVPSESSGPAAAPTPTDAATPTPTDVTTPAPRGSTYGRTRGRDTSTRPREAIQIRFKHS